MISRPVPSGATAVAGVIGDPVEHSQSPALHNAAFAACDLDWNFVAFPVSAGSGTAAVSAMRTLGIRGLSVTMPHKHDVATAADRRSTEVDVLGAANCLVLDHDGLVTAHNTDGAGFIKALAAEADQAVTGRSVLVFGAGGAARAVIDACARSGAAEIIVVNRSVDKARSAASLAGSSGRVGDPSDAADVEIVVNATPLGMAADSSMPCDPTTFGSSQLVIDLIYDPWDTEWLAGARRQGAAVMNGFAMLLHQAASQFSMWTGLEAPIDAMAAAAHPQIRGT